MKTRVVIVSSWMSAAAAVALACIGRELSSRGCRVWGRAGRALAKMTGMGYGARGGVWVRREVASRVAALVRSGRLVRSIYRVARKEPNLLYPLTLEKLAALYHVLGARAARRIVRTYAAKYPSSRVARLYRRIRAARIAAWARTHTVIEEIAEWLAYRVGILLEEARRVAQEAYRRALALCSRVDADCLREAIAAVASELGYWEEW